MGYNSMEGIVFPSKSDIFVPQSFQTLVYKENFRLEEKHVWQECKEREDIGKFIADTLRHPVLGRVPML